METLLCPSCFYQNKYSRRPQTCHLPSQTHCGQCNEEIQYGDIYIPRITKILDHEIWRNEKFCEPEIQDYCERMIAHLEYIKQQIIPMFEGKSPDQVIVTIKKMVSR